MPHLRFIDGSPPRYLQYDRGRMPVTVMATDYPAGHFTTRHRHPNAQLLYAVHGVMEISTGHGKWVVPPTRGMWMPAETDHQVRMVSEVHMRSAFIRPDAAPDLPANNAVLSISPLLRELILAALDIKPPYSADSREGRVMRLMLDELRTLPSLPLHLPLPNDPLLIPVCESLRAAPDDVSTAEDWSRRLDIDPRTLQRRFAKATGMSFAQWRQQARLLEALERLAGGERVLDVALALGYSSPTAFTTMFKRQFGVTPSAFF